MKQPETNQNLTKAMLESRHNGLTLMSVYRNIVIHNFDNLKNSYFSLSSSILSKITNCVYCSNNHISQAISYHKSLDKY